MDVGFAHDGSVKVTASDDARGQAEDVVLNALMSFRGLHVLQAAVTTAVSWRAWRRPRLAAATLVVSGAESLWYARRVRSRRAVNDATATWIDTGVGLGGLVALRAATTAADCTSWMNWMCPINLGSVAAAAASLSRRDAGLALAAVTGTYLLSVKDSIAGDPSVLATVVVSALGYVAMYVVGDQFARRVRTSAIEIDAARRAAVLSGERSALEQERERQHRLMSRAALEALDLVARGWSDDDDNDVRAQVRREAARLRNALSGDNSDRTVGLAAALRALAEDAAADGLVVELLLDELVGEPSAAGTTALATATREALDNVARHAGLSRAVVRASCTADHVEVTVRDHGTGCDPDHLAGHLHGSGGIASRIVAPIRDQGGIAELWSAPGRGMLVTVRVAPSTD